MNKFDYFLLVNCNLQIYSQSAGGNRSITRLLPQVIAVSRSLRLKLFNCD